MKLKLIFSYDGSAFLGSAKQPHLKGVQDSLQNALKHLGISKPVLFASRTDKGVHANKAVASIECEDFFKDLKNLKNQINRFAHPFIHIRKIQRVEEDFEVRFCVKAREYNYVFFHGDFNPFLARYVHFYPPFEIKRALEILSLFKGKHDFRYFSKSKGGAKTSTREMFYIKAYRYKKITIFKFRANGFLRAQIRLMVASVLAVLEGRLKEEELKEQLELKNCYFRLLVPPNGLYLSRIIY